MEQLRMNDAYWGFIVVDHLGRLGVVDQEAISANMSMVSKLISSHN